MEAGTKQYFENVRKEIVNLRKFAKKSELKKLNFKKLNPEHTKLCIYGQMTGDCENYRSAELIWKCCNVRSSFSGLNERKTQRVKPRSAEKWYSFSYLEHCIYSFRNNNKGIIDYLKGKTDVLELSKN